MGAATPLIVTVVPLSVVGSVVLGSDRTPVVGPRFTPNKLIWSPGATSPVRKLDVLTMVFGPIAGGPSTAPVIVIENPVTVPVRLLPLFSTPRRQLPKAFWLFQLASG